MPNRCHPVDRSIKLPRFLNPRQGSRTFYRPVKADQLVFRPLLVSSIPAAPGATLGLELHSHSHHCHRAGLSLRSHIRQVCNRITATQPVSPSFLYLAATPRITEKKRFPRYPQTTANKHATALRYVDLLALWAYPRISSRFQEGEIPKPFPYCRRSSSSS